MSEPKPFNWRTALENPPEKDSLDHDELKHLASQWPSCACGMASPLIPRFPSGCPQDYRMRNLGECFSCYVNFAHWSQALATLDDIEAREAELLAPRN